MSGAEPWAPLAAAGLGLPRVGTPRLKPHDPAWAPAFRAEAHRIRAAVGAELALAHVGSTSVPGLEAKPILDLLGAAPNLAWLDARREAFEGLGYGWKGEFGIPGRRYLNLHDGAQLVGFVHLHLFAHGDEGLWRHIAFRDWLRAHPAQRLAYQELKRALCAAQVEREAYADAKDAWVGPAEAEALAWAPQPEGWRLASEA